MSTTTQSSIEAADISSLAILAGGGDLPLLLAEKCKAHGTNVFIIAFEGQTSPEWVGEHEHVWLRYGTSGQIPCLLSERNINNLVMIGSMNRPSLSDLKPDLETLITIVKIGFHSMLSKCGDDGLLKALKNVLNKKGVHVHGIQKFMPELLTPLGAIGKISPSRLNAKDIKAGVIAAQIIGRADIGQSVIVNEGRILGLEAAEGTDSLIKRCAEYRKKAKGGVLVKLCKPNQDRDLDLPTIGVQTVHNVVAAGYDGIAVHAGHSLIVNIDDVRRLADEKKIFITGINPDEEKP